MLRCIMPDHQGKLSADEAQNVREWLMAHSKGTCPACASGKWTLANHVINLSSFTPGRMTIGGPSYPAILIVCDICGYFRMHSAIMAGVVAADRPKQEAVSGSKTS